MRQLDPPTCCDEAGCRGHVRANQPVEVVEAANGDEGFARLRADGRYSLLVTDVQMPGSMDGVDLAIFARSRDPGLPIIVVSGYAADLEERLSGLRPSPVLLGKPYTLDDIVEAVRALTRES